MSANAVGLEDVAALALRLSPLERVKLAERLIATVAQDLTALDEVERASRRLAEAKAQASDLVGLDEVLARNDERLHAKTYPTRKRRSSSTRIVKLGGILKGYDFSPQLLAQARREMWKRFEDTQA